jgi:hypothetical protein
MKAEATQTKTNDKSQNATQPRLRKDLEFEEHNNTTIAGAAQPMGHTSEAISRQGDL